MSEEKPKRELAPEEMDDAYLLQLAFEMYARSVMDNSEQLHNRAWALRNEISRRLAKDNYLLTVNDKGELWLHPNREPENTASAFNQALDELVSMRESRRSIDPKVKPKVHGD